MAEESGEATVLGKDSQSATLAFLDAVKYALFLSSQRDEISGNLLHAEAGQGLAADFKLVWPGPI